MSLIKLNNNAVKNIDSLANVGTGDLVFISKQTASSSASISFTSGIDSTYKEYVFYFVNMHPQNDSVNFSFQASTDGGSNYNVTTTSSFFEAYHNESDTTSTLSYNGSFDLAQSTSFQTILSGVGNDADKSCVGTLQIFNPSSTTFVKHFLARGSRYTYDNFASEQNLGGYFNTTTAINAIQFKFSSGNIDAGDILLYGVN